MSEPTYPDVEVQLTGTDGNVFAIIGRVCKALYNAGHKQGSTVFREQALVCGSYDAVLQLCMKTVQVLALLLFLAGQAAAAPIPLLGGVWWTEQSTDWFADLTAQRGPAFSVSPFTLGWADDWEAALLAGVWGDQETGWGDAWVLSQGLLEFTYAGPPFLPRGAEPWETTRDFTMVGTVQVYRYADAFQFERVDLAAFDVIGQGSAHVSWCPYPLCGDRDGMRAQYRLTASVPEPATWIFLTMGLIGMALCAGGSAREEVTP